MRESLKIPYDAKTLRQHIQVPQGLPELMEGLAKEILMKQPANIMAFAADYFENLINIRDATIPKTDEHIYQHRPKKPVKNPETSENIKTELNGPSITTASRSREKLQLANTQHAVINYMRKTPTPVNIYNAEETESTANEDIIDKVEMAESSNEIVSEEVDIEMKDKDDQIDISIISEKVDITIKGEEDQKIAISETQSNSGSITEDSAKETITLHNELLENDVENIDNKIDVSNNIEINNQETGTFDALRNDTSNKEADDVEITQVTENVLECEESPKTKVESLSNDIDINDQEKKTDALRIDTPNNKADDAEVTQVTQESVESAKINIASSDDEIMMNQVGGEEQQNNSETTSVNIVDIGVSNDPPTPKETETSDDITDDPITVIEASTLAPETEVKKEENRLYAAAMLIQRIFRKFIAQKKVKLEKDKEIPSAKEDLDLELPDETKEVEAKAVPLTSQSTEDDSSALSSAATIIQAGVRRYLTRKSLQKNRTRLDSTDTTAASFFDESKSLDDNFEIAEKPVIIKPKIILEATLESTVPVNGSETQNSNLRAIEARKRLKREDAIQSPSPNSSGEAVTTQDDNGNDNDNDDEEPIGDLAKGIITEIIMNPKKLLAVEDIKESFIHRKSMTFDDSLYTSHNSNIEKTKLFLTREREFSDLIENDEVVNSTEIAENIVKENVNVLSEADTFQNIIFNDDHTKKLDRNDVETILPVMIDEEVVTAVSNVDLAAAESDEETVAVDKVVDDRVDENFNEATEPREMEKPMRLIHSGEFHDVLPTRIIRKDPATLCGE